MTTCNIMNHDKAEEMKMQKIFFFNLQPCTHTSIQYLVFGLLSKTFNVIFWSNQNDLVITTETEMINSYFLNLRIHNFNLYIRSKSRFLNSDYFIKHDKTYINTDYKRKAIIKSERRLFCEQCLQITILKSKRRHNQSVCLFVRQSSQFP